MFLIESTISRYIVKLSGWVINFGVSLVLGGSPGPGGKLASNLTTAHIYIPTNDNPYGLFAFAQNSLDVSVAEDTKPGYEFEATANLTVLRKRGKDRDVEVSIK